MICSKCKRGREACGYCYSGSEEDFETICDCGLYDFGHHLFDCLERNDKRWVIPLDYASAEEPIR